MYVYDPPNNRRGLSRRIQDNVSWSGPGVVVCVERDRPVPNKVWVRIKGRVRALPLERIRLATVEEVASGQFIKEAVEDLEKELTQGRVQVSNEDVGEGREPSGDDSSGNSEDEEDRVKYGEAEVDPPERQLQQQLLQDVPLGFRSEKQDPSALSFNQKKKLFARLAETDEPPSKFQEARIRGELEASYRSARGIHRATGSRSTGAPAEPERARSSGEAREKRPKVEQRGVRRVGEEQEEGRVKRPRP